MTITKSPRVSNFQRAVTTTGNFRSLPEPHVASDQPPSPGWEPRIQSQCEAYASRAARGMGAGPRLNRTHTSAGVSANVGQFQTMFLQMKESFKLCMY